MDNRQTLNNLIVIHVGEIIQLLLKRLVIFILIGALGLGAGAAYGMTRKTTPMYRATTKLYVTGVDTAVPSSSGFSLGRAVIKNYQEIIHSRPVLESVIENLGLNMSTRELSGCISESNPADTAMMTINVTFPDPQWAKAVADEVVVESAAYALEIMGMTPPTVYEEATVPGAPYNSTGNGDMIKFGLLGGVGAGALAVFLTLFFYFVSTKFNNPDKIKDRLHLETYGMIPDERKKGKVNYGNAAYKNLYARLKQDNKDDRVIAFVGCDNAENKGEAIQGLAEFMKTIGKKATVIDTNLGHPEWSSTSVPGDSKGLEEYLIDTATIEEIIFTDAKDVDHIGVKSGSQDVMGLIDSAAFDKLLKTVAENSDYVLLDTAPVSFSRETREILKKADASLVVVSAAKDRTYKVKEALKKLAEDEIKMDGAVLKDVAVKKSNKYFMKNFGAYLDVFAEGKKSKKNK